MCYKRSLAISLSVLATVCASQSAHLRAGQTSSASRPARAGEQAFRALYKELVEINTTLSVGSCTTAANAMKAHLARAGYPENDLHLIAPPDQPKLTQYQLIQANASVANGVATSPELLARSAFLDVTGSGTLVLADGVLDYAMRATLTQPIAIPNCNSMDRLVGGSFPFTIKGPLDSAVPVPDFGQIIQERVRDELRERILERLLQ